MGKREREKESKTRQSNSKGEEEEVSQRVPEHKRTSTREGGNELERQDLTGSRLKVTVYAWVAFRLAFRGHMT